MDNLLADIKRYSYDEEVFSIQAVACAVTKLGFWALLNYRIGVYLRKVFGKTIVINKLIKILTALSRVFTEILTGVSISYHSQIGPGILIAHFSNIIIGDGVVIGKGATLHQGVTIGVSGRNESRGVPLIGDNFFAGANAVVAGKIIIGNNVAVSANSFVNHNVASDSIVNNQELKIVSRKGAQHV